MSITGAMLEIRNIMLRMHEEKRIIREKLTPLYEKRDQLHEEYARVAKEIEKLESKLYDA